MENCIFCKIVAGEIPAAKVYEDDNVLAFLDIKPVQPGHVLVIPKVHHSNITEAPDEVVSQVMIQAKRLMTVVQRAVGADYTALSVVGTEVPHLHVHVVPRHKDDGLAGWWPTMEYGAGEMEAVAEKIRLAL
jgi:histidine triad (HIT) family protein